MNTHPFVKQSVALSSRPSESDVLNQTQPQAYYELAERIELLTQTLQAMQLHEADFAAASTPRIEPEEFPLAIAAG